MTEKLKQWLLVAFIVTPTILVLIVVFNASYKYILPSFRGFINACEEIEVGLTKEDLLVRMNKYQLTKYSKTNKDTYGKKHALAFRLNKKYSGDLCFVYLSKENTVVKAEFSPD